MKQRRQTMGPASVTTKTKPARPPRPRSKGRPPAEAEGVGRDTIIAHTCELLRTHPPSAVTRVMAARASNVHPSLIHYYFRTRSSLMVAAAEKLSHEFRQAVAVRTQGATGSPRERLRARIEALIDLEMTYPYFHRLLVEEVLTSDEPGAKALSADLASRGITSYQALIDEGTAAGELRPVDSGWLFTSVISLCQFFDKAQVLYRVLAHPDVSGAELDQSYRAFLIDFIMHAVDLCPDPQTVTDDAAAT